LGGFTTRTSDSVPVKVWSPRDRGAFWVAVANNDRNTLKNMGSQWVEYQYEAKDEVKVLGDQTGAAGGFTVPPGISNDFIRIDPEDEIVMPRADVIPMTTRTLPVPGLDTTGSTPGRSNFFGGVVMHWVETGTQKGETEPAFTQIELVAHEASGYTEVKEALLADSPISLDTLLRGLFREAVTFYRDEAFLDGTAVGQPQGVIMAPGTFVQARQTAGTITYLDLVRMKGHFLPRSWTRGMWVFHISCYETLRTLQDPAGHYIWATDAVGGEPQTILGLPWTFTEKTRTLGLRGDVILADWKYYYVGNRQDFTVAASRDAEHVFRQNRVAYKFVIRVDGQEKLRAPVFLKDGVTEVSPFVVLDVEAATS